MIALTWVPEFIQGLIWLYLIVWAAASIAALLLPKTWKGRVGTLLLVTLAFGALPAHLEFKSRKHKEEQQPIVDQRKAQYEAAMARFEERCKTAGEKVYRTVEDVEGVLLMKVRPKKSPSVYADPNWPDAGMPDESSGDDYLRTFLNWEQRRDAKESRGYLNYSPSELPGYRFVDVIAESGGFQRIRLDKAESANLILEPLKSKPARYAVSFENLVDPEDRKLWVAGTKVTVTDTSNNEVLAEKTWYSVEPGQGSQEGARSPWAFARTCPMHLGRSNGQTRFFVDQILKPKKGE